MQIVLVLTVCVLSGLYATGILGALGAVLMLVAVAMNVLLLLEFDNFKVKIFILLFVNIIPFSAAAVFLQSVVMALGALYPLVMAMPIWLTVKKGYGRSASIALAAIGAMLVWCISFVLSIISELGAFNSETLGTLLDSIFDPYVEYFLSAAGSEDGGILSQITSADIDMMRYYFKTMFFGSIGMTMIVWAYFATLATRLVAKIFGASWRLPVSYRVGFRAKLTNDGPQVEVMHERVPWRIQLDVISVGVYVAAYIIAVLFAPSDGVLLTLYTVAINLILILSPGFLYCGLRDIVLGFRRKSTTGALGYITFAVGLVMMFISPISIVIMLCALGVIVTVRENRVRRNSEKIGKE